MKLELNDHEATILVELLRMASETYSNHGCNDFDLSKYIKNQTERVDFVRTVLQWNEPKREPEPDFERSPFALGDSTLMSYFADLIEEAENKSYKGNDEV